jgi:hypothetical protein
MSTIEDRASKLENTAAKTEVQMEMLIENLKDIKHFQERLATKQDIANMIEQHSYSCSLKDKVICREEFYNHFIISMGKFIKEKESAVNRTATFLKNLFYIISIIVSASVLGMAGYWFIINSIKGG